MRSTLSFSLVCTTLSLSSSALGSYVWPSQWDALEDIYTVTSGFGSSGLFGGVSPCSKSPGRSGSGRVASAEWIRLAYHDMATYDITQGAGGLDASIQFELSRDQNVGKGMTSTMSFFAPFVAKHVSLSDIIALGTVFSVKSCSGPSIPFRPGRVDATVAGPEDVPEPQQDLATHTAMFARQGFNQSEMIGLVACGHTLGGVHEVDFPSICPGTIRPGNSDGVAAFDDTIAVFDNHVAQGWISRTPTNKLAFGPNKAANSDARIFGSDNDQVMKAFANDGNFFASQCQSYLGRMINSVPSSVKLGDAFDPLPVKPSHMSLTLGNNGKLQLVGTIRIFGNTQAASQAVASLMPVSITWNNKAGQNCGGPSCTVKALTNPSLQAGSAWGSVQFFELSALIDPVQGISSFYVDWAYAQGGALTRANNGGAGFPMQDMVLFQPQLSCFTMFEGKITVTAVIRNNAGNVNSAYLDYSYGAPQAGSSVAKIVTERHPLTIAPQIRTSSPLYTTYTATWTRQHATLNTRSSVDVSAVIGGQTYTTTDHEVSSHCSFFGQH